MRVWALCAVLGVYQTQVWPQARLLSAVNLHPGATRAVPSPSQSADIDGVLASDEASATGAPGATTTIEWRCGGLSRDESTAMRAQMKAHALSLLFARRGGADLADVQVDMRAVRTGVSQSWRADGPVCLLSLAPGQYEVDAQLGAQRQSRHIEVGTTPQVVDIRFD